MANAVAVPPHNRVSVPPSPISRVVRLIPGDSIELSLELVRRDPSHHCVIELEPGLHYNKGETVRIPSNVHLRGLGGAVVQNSIVFDGDNITVSNLVFSPHNLSIPTLQFGDKARTVTLDNVAVTAGAMGEKVSLLTGGTKSLRLHFTGTNTFSCVPRSAPVLDLASGGIYTQTGTIAIGCSTVTEKRNVVRIVSPKCILFDGTVCLWGSMYITGNAEEAESPIQIHNLIIRHGESELPPISLVGLGRYHVSFGTLMAYRKGAPLSQYGIVSAFEAEKGYPKNPQTKLADDTHLSIGCAFAPTDGAYAFLSGATNVQEGDGAAFSAQQLNQPPSDV